MGKLKSVFQNMSLRKSLACYIAVFALLAVFLVGITESVCQSGIDAIYAKYPDERERYYLVNEDGQRLGDESTYVYKTPRALPQEADRMLDILENLPMLLTPVYSAICVLAAAMLFYRRKLKRPLALLTEASEKISQNDLDFSVKYDSADEMGRLCGSFELMRAALEKNQKEMWRAMEERKRLNAAFAHDLRTPLTVLRGCNEMLQLTGNEQERHTADMIQKHIRRLENYAGSMSSVQRLEDRAPDYRILRLKKFLETMEQSAGVLCAQYDRELHFDDQTVSAELCMDEDILQQVFENLLSNAVRYAQTYVAVQVQEREDGLLLTVADDGGGFSEKGLKNAAEPYYREQKNRTAAESDGADHFGLGLYICRVLCRQHGGWLEITNRNPGAKVTAFFQKKTES